MALKRTFCLSPSRKSAGETLKRRRKISSIHSGGHIKCMWQPARDDSEVNASVNESDNSTHRLLRLRCDRFIKFSRLRGVRESTKANHGMCPVITDEDSRRWCSRRRTLCGESPWLRILRVVYLALIWWRKRHTTSANYITNNCHYATQISLDGQD